MRKPRQFVMKVTYDAGVDVLRILFSNAPNEESD
jgi:hypothetical protein